jgi:hypothetical protein
MKEDGTDVENIWLSLPGEDSDDHTDGEDPTEDDRSADEGEAEVVDGVDEDDYGSTWDYTAYSQFTMTDDGSIYGIRYEAHEDYSDPDNYVSEQHDYVCCWNREGEFLWEVELEDLRNIDEGEEWLYIGKIFPGEDGSLNVLLTGDNAYLLSVSADGVVSGRQAFADDVSQVLNNYQYILPREDGSLTIVYMDDRL